MPQSLMEQLSRRVGFGPRDQRYLHSLVKPLRASLQGIVKDFAAVLGEDAGARVLLDGQSDGSGDLQAALEKWLVELLTAARDDDYLARRWEIGRAHVKWGIPQHNMPATIAQIRGSLISAIGKRSLPAAAAKIAAINKALDLDLAIMLEAYREDYVARMLASERQILEKRLYEAEHMATIGQLAASLAHELKNPLAGISGAIQVIGEAMPHNDPHQEVIGDILRQIDRLDAAVRDLLVYSRPKPPELRSHSLGEVLQRALTLLREEPTMRNVRIHTRGLQNAVRLPLDETQMQQVITNLLLNAAQACAQEGDIYLTMQQEGRSVLLEVRDEGIGMSPEVAARAFEPFFTTKSRGTGLGLPICKRIVEAHGGRIHLSSRRAYGTTVRVELPISS
jgi:signal transduction histidine kinase